MTGANSGIGRTITESFSEAGSVLVYATTRNEKALSALNKLNNVHALKLDVTKQKQVDQAVSEIRQRGDGLYGLVNNAGIVDFWPLAESEISDLQRIFDVNLFGIHRMTRAVLPLLAESRGRIVNISSIQGLVSSKFSGLYEMTKHALEAYSDTLSKELKGYDVTVSIVEPGGFQTNYAKTTARLLKSRVRHKSTVLMRSEVTQIEQGWDKIVAEVAGRPTPEPVAEAVYDALFSEHPRHRYLVTPRGSEFRWAMAGLLSKVIDVNRASNHSLSNDELDKLLDELWDQPPVKE